MSDASRWVKRAKELSERATSIERQIVEGEFSADEENKLLKEASLLRMQAREDEKGARMRRLSTHAFYKSPR